MIAFAELLERLTLTPGRLAKIALLRRFFETEPDPDRGIGLAALTGELSFEAAKPALIRALAESRTDPTLFAWSYDYVGDLAETTALMWPDPEPDRRRNAPVPSLAEVVDGLATTPKTQLPALVAEWLDLSTPEVRVAILKLITSTLRVGASGRLAKVALAELGGGRIAADDIEELWHGLQPPYGELFRWIEGRGPKPDPRDAPVFRPPMLAHPLEDADVAALDHALFAAEWKWDGIRVQLVATQGGRRLYSRGADDISAAFPEIVEAMRFDAVLDGELLVVRDGAVAPFADLQQRLNRKAPTARMMENYPVAVRLYDILFEAGEDLRPLPFAERRARLEAFVREEAPDRMSLSELIEVPTLAELQELRAGARAASIEGLMLKRRDSPYLPGRPKGLWWKWKRDPLNIDAVMMYAQRGHGKRSSFYSDYTFGLWRDTADGGRELVPVGKAYSGYTDAELKQLDRWIRNNTVHRFGPVREVSHAEDHGLVLEIAFDAAQLSARHKSGVAMRFPRINRLRLDKPPGEADRLETLMALVEGVAVEQ
ncbi:cisplatin damage response ATP-dependent DNA ligase [Rhizosaccharibacter radicis]|uniref:DNA ligase (ATP) n=1 Tax=Rhizosaccharibacter radicis TaxID=2782605 RepID=A0ABT1VTW8_9PROT|nr:cisplatin damage response ATP-dependent DNA ligase [Acetobacteraceae bacterium KSS12]